MRGLLVQHLTGQTVPGPPRPAPASWPWWVSTDYAGSLGQTCPQDPARRRAPRMPPCPGAPPASLDPHLCRAAPWSASNASLRVGAALCPFPFLALPGTFFVGIARYLALRPKAARRAAARYSLCWRTADQHSAWRWESLG